MSVVAYDGVTIAADRMMSGQSDAYATCKLFQHGGWTWGVVGNGYHMQELKAWIMKGCNADTFPACQRGEQYATALGVEHTTGRVCEIGKSPYPIEVLSIPVAIGSGCEYARAAMLLGLDAVKAVEFASKHVYTCGMGIDSEQIRN